MTKTQNTLSYDSTYISNILQEFQQYKLELNGLPNVTIFCKERKINVSTFRNWLRTKTKTPISLIRETLQTWTKKQLQNGNKVTTKELMDKINQNYPTILKHKKYNAKRMFVKRIIDNATQKPKYKKIQNNIYKNTPPKLHTNTHSKIPKSTVQLELFNTQTKGLGIRTFQKIRKGTFIIEYIGEIINKKQYVEKLYKGRGVYIMDADNDIYIDAEIKGNYSRFINHDCNPNAVSVLRYIKGFPRILIMSKKIIKEKEEITISYGNKYSFDDGCRCSSCHAKSN